MYYSIQYLRAVAALMVVCTHITYKLNTNSLSFVGSFDVGAYGVDLFFVISGFIMTNTIVNKPNRPVKFLMARFKRIFPLYWLLTLVSLCIYLYNPSLINSSGGTTNLIASFTLMPTNDKLLINNGWTLTYEFIFYFIFSFCMFFRNPVLICSLIIPFLFILGVAFTEGNAYWLHFTSPLLLEFGLGIIAYVFVVKFKFFRKISLLLIFISLTLLFIQCFSGTYNNDFERVIYGGLPMFLLLLGCVSLEGDITIELKNKLTPLYDVGMSSYSLYLLHPFVLSGLTIFLSKIGMINYSLFYAGLMLISSVVISYYLYKFVEIPLSNVFKVNRNIRKYE